MTERRRFLGCIAATLIFAGSAARAAEIRVLTSGAFAAALSELAPAFERATGSKIITIEGASIGSGPDTIPNRLQRGEDVDVLIMSAASVDQFIKTGKVIPGSRVDLGQSGIGMAVRAGAPKPDIRTVEGLKRALLDAKSIAYSSSISGVYLSTELFQKLGIAEQVLAKSRKIEGERVGAVVARGEAEIGFQQTSELIPVAGIDYVGPLPAEVQRTTIFAAGIVATSTRPDDARALIKFLAGPAALEAVKRSGLEPVAVASR
jgi:molybdate transport system substrate-binding protein